MGDSPRPAKRVRLTPPEEDKQLRGPQLLLAIPSLLAHPPTNGAHARALSVSLLALRRCLGIPNPGGMSTKRRLAGEAHLSQPDECRAWIALAEIGLCVLEGGFEDQSWAAGIDGEVERALGKALIIAEKHPSLASYPPYLTLLSARAAPQRARQLLRPSPTSFGSTLPTAAYYYTHLAWVDHLLQAMLYPTTQAKPTPFNPGKNKMAMSTPTKSKTLATRDRETTRDLAAFRAALNPLLSAPHSNITLLTRVIELRALIALGQWTELPGALQRADAAMGIVIPAPEPASDAEPPLYMTSPFHATLVIHVLVLGVIWLTYSMTPTQNSNEGKNSPVSARLSLLYTLLDTGVYNGKRHAGTKIMPLESEGIIEVQLDPSSLPVYIRSTHPRVLYAFGYLISAVARRDLLGRKPKRKTFLLEGLGVCEREAGRELRLPRWASAGEVRAVELQMAKIKADMMCELAGVCIMRSEFADAEQKLNEVIAHARTHGLFAGALAHRITLLHAHLAHALGRTTRAYTCYRVAVQLAEEVGDVAGSASARAGEVALLVGLRSRARLRACGRELIPLAEEDEDLANIGQAELGRLGQEAAAACGVLGGGMRAVGEVLQGVLTTEILTAKQHLKNALSYATECQDNHLRALILALIAAHYMHTASGEAKKMLSTCEQLAAGLGAPEKKAKGHFDTSGNVPLRLWTGERFLELFKRDGQEDLAEKREEANGLLRQAVVALSQQGATASLKP
ncbi:hypothetical protein FB45DRAFT_931858 [Roridomyces roridus]|uniref:Uncharacterized protein n=1 Tax=Roridomyces roridus TaxID=1738132 RepID=A0AAD7FH69_9AGAR|nr:hypothetical protein FB45DRAFT_931858 [Roridomyces roridus]